MLTNMKTVKCPKCGKKAEKHGITVTSKGRVQYYMHKFTAREVYFCAVLVRKFK